MGCPMKRQPINLAPFSDPTEDRTFQWVIWTLVGLSVFLFGFMVGAILWGYVQYSS